MLQLRHLLVLSIILSLTTSQDSGLPGFVEVTSENGGSIGRISRCGEDDARMICVKYYQCDPTTKTVVKTGVTDGFGIINIRIDENSCEDYLEICCKLPDGEDNTETKNPVTPVGPPATQTPPPQPTRTGCGQRNANGIDFRITGAEDREAEYGEFPWMAAVMKRVQPENGKPLLCGASLLSDRVVLTGAHCVHRLSPRDVRVRVGEWDTQSTSERLPHQDRDVTSIIVHENFNPDTLFDDIALLILQKPIRPAKNVGTICLPVQDQVVQSRNCFVTGWGKDEFGRAGKYQSILKKIQLPTVGFSDCQRALRKTRLGNIFILDQSFTCAGGEEGRDACTGDGGSPLACPDPLHPDRYIQVGIVAWGIGCGEHGVPGVYTNVAKFRNWVDQHMESLNMDTSSYN